MAVFRLIFSYSRVETFKQCPYRFYLRYKRELDTLPETDSADNALFLGSGIHKGIETTVSQGVNEYFNQYPIITDLHINEAIKFEVLIPKVQALFRDKVVKYEQELKTLTFLGYIDALIQVGPNEFEIYDFKYSNAVDRYLDSGQLHVYKHYLESIHIGARVTKLGFIFIPKIRIRQRSCETLSEFRRRLADTLQDTDIKVVEVPFNSAKVTEFFNSTRTIRQAVDFPKNETRLCDWCPYRLYCQQGLTFMLLPKDERRAINAASRKKVWIYGAPFSGKTTLADQFPHPIMLNTDGNLNSFTSPYIEIKDTFEGRIKVLAWDNFKQAICELQKGGHSYQTVVVDLIEDTYEHCRRYCYDKLGIEHESDNSFKAWDYVRNEFLTTIKALMTLPYNIVLISHEDLSKDITRKTGDKITAIRPNIQDKLANKLAGMVDLVGRVIADGDARTLNFKSDHVIFGGGRLKLTKFVIPCNYAALCEVYNEQGPAPVPVSLPAQPVRSIRQ